jgi:mannose-6-phosphate isomerase-like protein (cupin superfamily)
MDSVNNVTDFIESGILEAYVLGATSEADALEVERMAAQYSEVRNEIEQISIALEKYAETQAMEPDPMIGPFLWARIDFTDRMRSGETPTFPALLHTGSKVADYSEWLNRPDMQLKGPIEGALARIIGFTPQYNTAIVWLEYGAPPETHTNEFEQFLIVEGTCEITIGEDIHELQPGDFLAIPLHISHNVRVTSTIPCKIILQRVAA